MLKWIIISLVGHGFVSVCADAAAPQYKKTGDTVVLSPGPVTETITKIRWKHNADMAMEWFQGSTDAYRQFKVRGSLDSSTGVMTVSGLTVEDSGVYTPVINNKVRVAMELQVIAPVSKPTYTKSCNKEDERICNYTCEVDTKDAEPISIMWTSDFQNLMETLSITPERQEKWFMCVVKNPVSRKSGDEILNPFNAHVIAASSIRTWIIISVILVVFFLFFFPLFIFLWWINKKWAKLYSGQMEKVVQFYSETSNQQDTSIHNPVYSVTLETEVQGTSAQDQTSASSLRTH